MQVRKRGGIVLAMLVLTLRDSSWGREFSLQLIAQGVEAVESSVYRNSVLDS